MEKHFDLYLYFRLSKLKSDSDESVTQYFFPEVAFLAAWSFLFSSFCQLYWSAQEKFSAEVQRFFKKSSWKKSERRRIANLD